MEKCSGIERTQGDLTAGTVGGGTQGGPVRLFFLSVTLELGSIEARALSVLILLSTG
jgi:hypothetical protein